MNTLLPLSWRRLTCVTAGALSLAALPVVSARSQAADKTIFVGVVDPAGKPVGDLTLADFAVREDNVNREVVSVKPATAPLYLYILADTTNQAGNTGMMGRESASGGTELIRDIRGSLTEFARKMYAANSNTFMGVMEFGQAAVPVMKFTDKLVDVEKGIARLFPKPNAASVLLEALTDAARALAKVPSPRRAVVSINIEPGDEQSREDPNRIMQALWDSGATLWAVSLQKGELRNPARDIVLNRLTQATGGRREFLIGPSAIENMLKTFGDALLSHYEVTYKRPASSAAVKQVDVGMVRRPGLRLHASHFAPK